MIKEIYSISEKIGELIEKLFYDDTETKKQIIEEITEIQTITKTILTTKLERRTQTVPPVRERRQHPIDDLESNK